MRFPPHFLHDSSGNSFRFCFNNFEFKAWVEFVHTKATNQLSIEMEKMVKEVGFKTKTKQIKDHLIVKNGSSNLVLYIIEIK